ncbi:Major facilitator superfamily domain general substrate transporter [Penicillium cf. griseofulvum]|nr:Major facilitator superfamily domain general substrate transporter [Penicillium cf. griseofulvum]
MAFFRELPIIHTTNPEYDMEIVRESPLGQFLRAITGNWILLYPEEKPGFVPSTPEETKYQIEVKQSIGSVSAIMTTSYRAHVENEYIVDWYGADDPLNPRNWSSWKKRFVTFQICLYTFAIYSGSSIYVPAVPQIIEHFQVSQMKASLGLALYVLGYGLGPLLFSPLSEVPLYGRNIPYITSLVIFVVLCIPTALVDNYTGFLILRLLQGFFGSPCLASGGASMADMYSDVYLPLGLTSWVAAAYGGPAFGPLLSAYTVAEKGVRWRWAMWEILWISAPILVLMIFCLPETSADNILLRCARRLRRITGNLNLLSRSEIVQSSQSFNNVIIHSLTKPVEIMIKDPAVLFANVYTSLVYGIYYSFFEAFPLVYPTKYGLDAQDVALIFLSIVIGCVLAMAMYILYLYTCLMPDLKANGQRAHEQRLMPALFASFGPPIGLFIFAWTTNGNIHWAVSALGIVIYAGSIFIILQCIAVYQPLAYPKYAASLFAGNDTTRSAVAFAFILFSRFMFIELGIDKGVTLLAGLSILGIIGMFILYFYGANLRARSRFAEHS